MDTTEYEQNKTQAEAQIKGWSRIAELNGHMRYTSYPDRLSERIQQLTEREEEGILSVEVEHTIRVVLCTGGPHCEVRWTDGGRPEVVCYGWFGGNRYERNLTDEEEEVLGNLLGGDFDEVVRSLTEREERGW
jgi:hypothetical protein